MVVRRVPGAALPVRVPEVHVVMLRLWEVKIVEPHSQTSWPIRAHDMPEAMRRLREHDQTRALLPRATHVAITLNPDEVPP